MKSILALLVAVILLTGCSAISEQPAALAYEGNPAPGETISETEWSLQDPSPTIQPVTEIPPAEPILPSPTPLPTEQTDKEPDLKPGPTSVPYHYAFGPYSFPADINPLTGLPVEDINLLKRRPIVIKVTNFPRSVRPQWGLSLADHVFEYFIGDSMSRFIGIFYGQDASRVGPIRSARLFDEHVMRIYQGIFIFGWADDPILNFLLAPDIKSHLIVERKDNCPPLCRIGEDGAYNNLFADTSQIGTYLTKRRTNNDRQVLDGLQFDLEAPKSGSPGEKIYLKYSVVSYNYWEYDPEKERYFRYQDTVNATDGKEQSYAPLTDSLTDAQLSTNNVIVLLVPHYYFLKSSSTEILDQLLLGEGKGYAFRDGLIYPINWSRERRDRQFKFTLPNGVQYSLKPGTTWFEVIGETSSFERLDDHSYRFEFGIP